MDFAPNGRELLLLTTSSKLKVYRIDTAEIQHSTDFHGLTEMNCTDFEISANNQVLICVGQEGVVKVYDYLMRGNNGVASSQVFLGHFKWPRKVIISHDMKYVFTIGDYNGLYRWMLHADKSMSGDINGTVHPLKKAIIPEESEAQEQQAEGDNQGAMLSAGFDSGE